MNLFDKLTSGYKALEAGKQLQDPAAWSSRANAAAILVVLINALVALGKAFGYDLQLDGVDVHTIANAVSAVGVGVVGVLHTASNVEAGRKSR